LADAGSAGTGGAAAGTGTSPGPATGSATSPGLRRGATGLVVALFVLNGAANGVFMPFAPAILVERGFEPGWVGVIGAAVSLAFLALAGAWGHLADVVLGRSRAFVVAYVGALALLGVFAVAGPLPVVAVAYVGFLTLYALVFPLQDALAVNALPDPARQYGTVRGLQSGAFALASFACGLAWAVTGYGPAAAAFAILALPVMVAALRVPDVARARLTTTGRGGAIREALAIQPLLPRLLLAIGLANVGVFAGLTFLPLLITRLGGGSGEIGLSVAATATLEVVIMPIASRLIARFGPRPVMTVSIGLLGVTFAWFALAPSPAHVIAASVLYGIAWSGMWVGSVTSIRSLLPPQLQGSGQTLLSLVTSGAAALLANVGGGLLWGGAGPSALFGLAAAFAAAGAVVAWWSVPRHPAPAAATAVEAPGTPA